MRSKVVLSPNDFIKGLKGNCYILKPDIGWGIVRLKFTFGIGNRNKGSFSVLVLVPYFFSVTEVFFSNSAYFFHYLESWCGQLSKLRPVLSSKKNFRDRFVGWCMFVFESLLWLFWESDINQNWRADLESSQNLESSFRQLSKLRPGITSNKFLRVCCWL